MPYVHYGPRCAQETAALADRLRGKLRREAKRLELRARRRRTGEDSCGSTTARPGCPSPITATSRRSSTTSISASGWPRSWQSSHRSFGPGPWCSTSAPNLGFYSALFAGQVGRGGRVVAFEPAPRVFAKLGATIARNGLDQVVALDCGCGSAGGEAVLHRVSTSTGTGSLLGGGLGSETVTIRRLDEIPQARERPPRLIKIDVEGFEPEVLAGARGILEEHRPILYIELCGEYAESSVRSVELLDELGYDTRAVVGLDWAEVPNGSNFVVRPAGSGD